MVFNVFSSKENFASKIKSDFVDLADFEAYKNDLLPILLDTHEIYKLAVKHNESMLKNVEGVLSALYFQFNPDAISRVKPNKEFL